MAELFSSPPVIGLAAYSGTGKTTLLSALLPLMADRGLRVAVIKHSHHDFEIDQAGKDSFRLRKAGAQQMLIASPYKTVVIEEQRPPREPCLTELLKKLDRRCVDLVLVEGFRDERFPKIELHRRALGGPFLHLHDSSIIAVASDCPLETALPQLDLNEPRQILHFIIDVFSPGHTGAFS